MYNDLFSIGPLTVHTYGLMTGIGIIVAYLLLESRGKKKNLDVDKVFGLLIWCVVFGYIGSKLLYFTTILPEIIANPSIIKDSLFSGWVVYGGILGGMVGGYLYCRRKKLNAWAYFDLGLVSMIIAQAFGRVGCFFAGCCYGMESHSAIAITFTHSDFAPNNIPLIPTQLIMSIGDFILFAFLVWYDKRKKNDGEVTGAYLTLYSFGRFVIEFLRGDVARGSVGPLSTSQFISIFVILVGIIIWVKRHKAEPSASEAVSEAGAEEDKESEPENKEETELDNKEEAEEADDLKDEVESEKTDDVKNEEKSEVDDALNKEESEKADGSEMDAESKTEQE